MIRRIVGLLCLMLSFTYAQAVVNINTATVEELQTLPHIGPVKAKAIEEYRRTNGFFKTKEEITMIKGIGKKTFEKLKDDISITHTKTSKPITANDSSLRKPMPITKMGY